MDIFHYVSLLDETIDYESDSFDVVEDQINRLFEESVEKSLVMGVDARDYDHARFAVCAWVDEVIMNMDWVHSNKWRTALRQSKYYGTTNAGVEFFERLNSIGQKRSSVREIFFVCLGLGFYGRYSVEKNRGQLREIIRNNYILLKKNTSASNNSINNKIFTSAYVSENTLNDIKTTDSLAVQVKNHFKIIIWIAPPMIVSALYIWYSLLLDSKMSALIVKIVG